MEMLDALNADVGADSSMRMLDLVFVMDCTGSMGSYIASALQNIEAICDNIVQSGKLMSPECLRIGLIAYRDHPPQDHTFLIKYFPFTSDVRNVKESLKGLYASGGGDGPEATTAAMAELLNLEWRPNASKMSVLITDAPPHGIFEYGDGFPDGSPDGHDPLQLARQMAQRGITLFVVACEPALSGYTNATDFYKALARITSATMLPLTNANLLAHVIVGSALEQMDMERLIGEVGQAVALRVHSGQETVDDIAKELHEKLMLRNESTKQLVVEDIYRDTHEARHNVEVWSSVQTLAEAKPHLLKVTGGRFNERYQASRSSMYGYHRSHASTSSYTYPPPVPPRAVSISPPPAPASPPRKVISEFKAFSADPSKLSMASASGSTPSSFSGPAFGLRSENPVASVGTTDVMEQAEDGDEGLQGVELKLAGISFDQARRITMQSAWRGLPSS